MNVSKEMAKVRSDVGSAIEDQATPISRRSAKVQVVVGDLFDVVGDLIVIPCSSQGTVNRGLAQKLDEYEVPYPPLMQLGDVQLVRAARLPDRVQSIAYAASVSGSSSNPNAIRLVGMNLGRLTRGNRRLRKITSPLLGTGAGKLKPRIAFDSLADGFKRTAVADATLCICVLDKTIAEELSRGV